MAFTQIPVTGTYRLADGTPAVGTVRFTPTAPMHNDGIVIAAPIVADLDEDGELSTTLAATDNAGTLPEGVGYRVEMVIAGQPATSYLIVVPESTSGALDLADVVPATLTASAVDTLTQTQADALYQALGTGGGTGTSTSTMTDGALSRGQRLLAEYQGRLSEVGETITVGTLVDADAVATAIPSGVEISGWDVRTGLRVLRCKAAQHSNPNYLEVDTATTTYAPGSQTGASLYFETQYSGTALDVIVRQGGTSGFEAQCTIWVNGRVVYDLTDTLAAASGVGAGGLIRIPLTFPNAQARTVAVEFRTPLGVFAGFVRTASGALVYPSSGSKGPRVIVASDSYGEGGEASPARGFVATLPLLIPDWPDVWNSSSGSTGYYADGARAALVDRYVNDIVDQDPNIVILALGLNDQSAYLSSPATVLTAVETSVDGILEGLPDVELIIVGPWWPGGDTPAEMIDFDLDMRAVAVERGLRFISPITEEWITGTGHVGDTQGDGNADTFIGSDGTHPTAAGHAYLAWRLAGHLQTFTADDKPAGLAVDARDYGTGTAAINAAIDAVYAAGGGVVHVPPIPDGWTIDRKDPDEQRNGGINMRSGVSVIGANTELVLDNNCAFFVGRSTFGTPTTITADTALGDRTLTVASTTGFTVGEEVFIRLGQAFYDAAEPHWWMWATVTAIPDGTHLTLDRPINYVADVSTITDPDQKSVAPVTSALRDIEISGFHLVNPATGDADAEAGIDLTHVRGARIDRISGVDPGAGLVLGQFCDDVHVGRLTVHRSVRQGENFSKGRGVALAECRNWRLDNVTLTECESNFIALEGRNENITFEHVTINNNYVDRNTSSPLIIHIGDSSGTYQTLLVTGEPSYFYDGGGDPQDVSEIMIGEANFYTSSDPNISSLDVFDGPLRIRDLVYRHRSRYVRTVALTSNMSGVSVPLPAGLARGYRIYCSHTGAAGVTALVLASAGSSGPDVFDRLIAGWTVNVGDGGLGPDYPVNDDDTNQLLLSTGASVAGGAELVVDFDYYLQPSPANGRAVPA